MKKVVIAGFMLALLVGCGKVVKSGDKIKVEYTGKLNTGEIFDSWDKHGNPLEFTAGSGQVITGFDKAVIGMKLNEQKTVNIKVSEAYGEIDKSMVRKFPRSMAKDPNIQVGQVLNMMVGGRSQIAKVVDMDSKEITLDFNHPLAGKDLVFDIKVVGIEKTK